VSERVELGVEVVEPLDLGVVEHEPPGHDVGRVRERPQVGERVPSTTRRSASLPVSMLPVTVSMPSIRALAPVAACSAWAGVSPP